MGLIHKEYYSANATYLSDEAIQEIKASRGTVVDAVKKMAKKFHISHARVLDYINNRERKQQKLESPNAQANTDSYNNEVIPSQTSIFLKEGGEKKKKVKGKSKSSKASSNISESVNEDANAKLIKEMKNTLAESSKILDMDDYQFLAS